MHARQGHLMGILLFSVVTRRLQQQRNLVGESGSRFEMRNARGNKDNFVESDSIVDGVNSAYTAEAFDGNYSLLTGHAEIATVEGSCG